MKLQEHIRKVLKEETDLPIYIRRRLTQEDLEWLVNDVKELIDYGESLDTAIYDGTREFIKSRKFPDIYEFGPDADYWESYLKYERPLVKYVRGRLNLQESITRIRREETKQIITPIINESMGYSKSVEQWADYISDEFLSKILRQNSTFRSHVYVLSKLSKKLNDTSFYKDLPIDNIVLNVSIDEVDDDDSSIDMEYLPYYTNIIENEDGTYRITDVKFNAVLTLPKDRESVNYDTIEYYFTSFLSHELMHLNEWVNRKLEYPKEVKDCGDVYSNGDIDGDAVDRIGYMIYVSQSYELNAFIQQAATLITKRNPKDKKEFMYYLDELPFYYIAETMIGFNKNTYMDEIKKLGKDRIDELAKMSLCFYDDKNKSLDKFLTDLDKRFKVRGEYLRRKLLRLVSLIK
jgi:hypothetical protein